MRTWIGTTCFLLLTSLAIAQDYRKHLYTRPSVPSREVLNRLNLRLNWRTRIPMRSKRDGIHSCQLAPIYDLKKKKWVMQLLVQTRFGLIVAVDGETGRQIWRTRVGNPYQVTEGLGFNFETVVAIREGFLYGLSRKTGEMLWKIVMKGTPATAPILSDEYIYLAVSTRQVAAYLLPSKRVPETKLAWEYSTLYPIESKLLLSRTQLLVPSVRGALLMLRKDISKLNDRLTTEDVLLAPPGLHPNDGIAYIGSKDSYVYARVVEKRIYVPGKPLVTGWRYSAGAPVTRSPVVTDEDVFVTADKKGLARVRRNAMNADEMSKYLIDRGLASASRVAALKKAILDNARDKTLPIDPRSILRGLQQQRVLTEDQIDNINWLGGEPVWRQPKADRVIAVNPKFVYATDRRGYLVILDRRRGTLLTRYNIRNWVFPVTNEYTDRLYLTAHDGLLVSLHDREYRQPVQMKLPLLPKFLLPKPKKK